MEVAEGLCSLVTSIANEQDTDRALDLLAQTALEWTGSRNALFARMNDELGSLELTNGAGEEWSLEASEKRLLLGDEAGSGIVAYVAVHGSAFVSGDVSSEPLYRKLFESSKSEVAVPVRDHYGRLRAVFNVESDQANAYAPEAVRICETIGGFASIVITREEQRRREEALVQIGIALDRAQTEDELIERLLNVAGDVLRFQSCSVFLYDASQDLYVLRGSIGTLKDKVGTASYAAGEGCTGWVCANGQPIRMDDPQNDRRWAGKFLEFPSEQIASFLAVPVMYRGQSVGAIRVVRRVSDNAHQDNRFTDDDERLLSTIAEQVATGLENIRSVQKAIRVERMAAWGELSAKSSHMIGNRVFALKGDVNELGHLLTAPELDRKELLVLKDSLETQVTRVEEILQEFRDFVMATQLSTARADLNFLVRGAVDEVFPRRSEVQLVYQLGEGLPEVDVDARKLRRAITEIVENSLSFFSKGRLRVATRMAEPALVKRTKLPATRDYVVIEVEDEGPGIEADQKQRIFQPFYSSRVKGMGLGLSIVKGILDGHGGAVLEDGEQGKGARFVMLLPVGKRPN